MSARTSSSDETAPTGPDLRQTSSDGGIAKTDAVAALGAQLQAQSNARARQEQARGFTGLVEVHVRAGCQSCATVLKTLQGMRIAPEQLVEVDVDASADFTPDATVEDASDDQLLLSRVEHTRANGVPQVYVLRKGEIAERIANLWMEIGSGAFQRRLAK
jgi:hypothetical protein